jgi:hypothetical protein
VRRCGMGQISKHTKHQRLVVRLKDATQQLAEVEREMREMEEGWGGSPLLVNPAQYQHDPMMLVYTARARGRYAYLQQEREALREMVYALRQWLKEVQP